MDSESLKAWALNQAGLAPLVMVGEDVSSLDNLAKHAVIHSCKRIAVALQANYRDELFREASKRSDPSPFAASTFLRVRAVLDAIRSGDLDLDIAPGLEITTDGVYHGRFINGPYQTVVMVKVRGAIDTECLWDDEIVVPAEP